MIDHYCLWPSLNAIHTGLFQFDSSLTYFQKALPGIKDDSLLKGDQSNAFSYLDTYISTTHQKAKLLNRHAVTLFREHKYAESIRMHLFTLELLKKDTTLKTHFIWTVIYQNLAMAYCYNGEKEKAMALFNKAQQFATDIRSDEAIKRIQADISVCAQH